jgi:RNA polymerase sigma-70 factor (ECF subfamily)
MSGRRPDLTTADLAAARRREPEAVARIYRAHASALFRFFLASTGHHQTAEDLTGSVFVAVIDALPGFRGPAEAFPSWLFTIARHDLWDHYRDNERRPTEPLDGQLENQRTVEAAPDPESIAIERARYDEVLAACRQLPGEQREALLLRLLGLRTAEIADVLGKTPGAVKAVQRRGLTRLARHLGMLSERR